MEVRGYGTRSAVSVDIYAGRPGGHGRYHPPGADALRRPSAHRQTFQPVRYLHASAMPTADVIVIVLSHCADTTPYNTRQPVCAVNY